MKKIFYQLSLSNILWHIAFAGLFVGSLYLVIVFIKVFIECLSSVSISNFLRILVGFAFFPLFAGIMPLTVRAVIKEGYNRVIYREHRFYITGELYREEIAEQCKDEIEVRSITNVKYLLTHRNSKKKGYSATPLEFFEFTLWDGSKKRMLISRFSRMQRKKILTIINNETGSDFSYKNLPKANYLMNGKRKRKKKSS